MNLMLLLASQYHFVLFGIFLKSELAPEPSLLKRMEIVHAWVQFFSQRPGQPAQAVLQLLDTCLAFSDLTHLKGYVHTTPVLGMLFWFFRPPVMSLASAVGP